MVNKEILRRLVHLSFLAELNGKKFKYFKSYIICIILLHCSMINKSNFLAVEFAYI